jgi:hypothetical protein
VFSNWYEQAAAAAATATAAALFVLSVVFHLLLPALPWPGLAWPAFDAGWCYLFLYLIYH